MDNRHFFNIQPAKWATHATQLRDVRRRVFIEEQRVPEEEEWDQYDTDSQTEHFFAQTNEHETVGCIRLITLHKKNTKALKITRLAVLKNYRRRGIATELLKTACQVALSKSPVELTLDAQLHITDLYKKFGFEEHGNVFVDAGINHQAMAFNQSCRDAYNHIFTDKVYRFHSAEAFKNHIIQQCNLGDRQLVICSQILRDDIFSGPDFIDALSRFARRDRRSSIRILVHNARQLSKKNQALIELARRLPGKIRIQTLTSVGSDDTPESFVCVDRERLVFFNDEVQLNGFCCYQAKAECKKRLEKFEHIWTHLSKSDPNLAALSL